MVICVYRDPCGREERSRGGRLTWFLRIAFLGGSVYSVSSCSNLGVYIYYTHAVLSHLGMLIVLLFSSTRMLFVFFLRYAKDLRIIVLRRRVRRATIELRIRST